MKRLPCCAAKLGVYAVLAGRANQYARWALLQGIEKGDTVCPLMPNRLDYLAIWLGLSRIGAVVALINANLTGETLAHVISAAAPKHIIVDTRLDAALEGLQTNAMVWRHGVAFAEQVSALPGGPLADWRKARRQARRSGATDLHLRHHRPAKGGSMSAITG